MPRTGYKELVERYKSQEDVLMQNNEELRKEAESLRAELKRIKIYMSMAAAILGKVKEEE